MGTDIGLMVSPDANLSLVQSALDGDEEALARIMVEGKDTTLVNTLCDELTDVVTKALG